MHGFAALDFRPRQRYTADKAASDKTAAAFDNIFLYFTPVQTLHKIWDRPAGSTEGRLDLQKFVSAYEASQLLAIGLWLLRLPDSLSIEK